MRSLPNDILIAARSRPEFLSRTTFFVVVVGSPVVTAVLFLALSTGGSGRGATQGGAVAAGLAVVAISSATMASAFLTTDKLSGTLPFVVLGSRGRPTVWLGRGVVVAGVGIATGLIGTATTLLVAEQGISITEALGLVALVIETAIVSLAMGVAVGAVGLVLRDSLLLSNLAQYLITVLCGAVAPLSVLPSPARAVALLFPMTYTVAAGRSLGQARTAVLYGAAGAMAGLVWAVAGAILWRSLERRSRRTGAIEAMSIV